MPRLVLSICALLLISACAPRVNMPLGSIVAPPSISPEDARRINERVRTDAYGMIFDRDYAPTLSFDCTPSEVSTIRGIFMTLLGSGAPGARPITLDAINSLSARCQRRFDRLAEAEDLRRIAGERAAREMSNLN